VLEKEFGGDLRDALIALMSEPVEYFAYRLKEAFDRFGTGAVHCARRQQ
jgi:hypothetical protein